MDVNLASIVCVLSTELPAFYPGVELGDEVYRVARHLSCHKNRECTPLGAIN